MFLIEYLCFGVKVSHLKYIVFLSKLSWRYNMKTLFMEITKNSHDFYIFIWLKVKMIIVKSTICVFFKK